MDKSTKFLLDDILGVFQDLFPILDTQIIRNKIFVAIEGYYVEKKSLQVEEGRRVEDTDFYEKIEIYLSAKHVEGLSALTLEGYKTELYSFAQYTRKSVNSIDISDVREYLANLKELKMSTIGKKLSVLKSFFCWLVQEEFIKRDPTKQIKTPKVEKRLPKSLSIEELELLRESCETIRQRMLMELLYSTGCRLSEIFNLNRDDINFQDMNIRVIGKGDKEREVYFSFKAMYYLRKYFASRGDDCKALLVTERKPYRRLSRGGIQKEIRIIRELAQLNKTLHPHKFRHTLATLSLNNGMDITAVQALLGHESLNTTMKYAQLTETRKREQYNKFFVQ